MLKRLYIVFALLLLSGLTLLHAEDSLLNGLRCGQIVTLTATPDAGYRFLGWSDGSMDNPRRVEVTEAMQIEAMFELACEAEYSIPVLYLYGHLYMVNNSALQSMGYSPQASEVSWYRIVGDIDQPNDDNPDDVLVATGFYLNRDGMADGHYYVQYKLPGNEDVECANLLRSPMVQISSTSLSEDEGGLLKIVPSLAQRGQMVELQGLPLTEEAQIKVYDTAGCLITTLYTDGLETLNLPSDNPSGCYLVRVTTHNIDRTLIYIIH